MPIVPPTPEEKAALFHQTAQRFYNLAPVA